MQVVYDKDTDILMLYLNNNRVEESDEEHPGVIMDYDDKGEVVSIEILDASRRIDDLQAVHYTTLSEHIVRPLS